MRPIYDWRPCRVKPALTKYFTKQFFLSKSWKFRFFFAFPKWNFFSPSRKAINCCLWFRDRIISSAQLCNPLNGNAHTRLKCLSDKSQLNTPRKVATDLDLIWLDYGASFGIKKSITNEIPHFITQGVKCDRLNSEECWMVLNARRDLIKKLIRWNL